MACLIPKLVFEQVSQAFIYLTCRLHLFFAAIPKTDGCVNNQCRLGNEYLSNILAILKEHQITATFFIEGRWAKENPDLVKMIAEGGHEIGNHSYSHPDMKMLSSEQIRKQLNDTNEIIKATTGSMPTLFAPPSGSYNDEVVRIAEHMKMQTIMWTIDTIDWKKPPAHTIIQRVTKQLHNGAIILAHPTESTEQAMDTLLTKIKEKGYRIGTVSNLLDEKD